MTIDLTIKHPEASMQGVPLVVLDQNHYGAKSYQELAEFILK